LELDSSTPTKFSRHLVIRIPGWAFASNAAVGAFVRSITCSKEGLDTLYINKDPPTAHQQQQQQQQQRQQQQQQQRQQQRVCFVDGAVYSKNRHFRLYGSTKGGKTAVLEPTMRYCMSAACRCEHS
jgi:hypothetical protein